jgi:roadblock/LC7 domain-containing protein
MADLQSLMTVGGVVAAFKFSSSGELEESKTRDNSEFTDTVLDLISHVCVANSAIATMQARGWENMTKMKGFYPIKGFTMVGFDWTVISSGQFAVIMPNTDVDYETAYAALNA